MSLFKKIKCGFSVLKFRLKTGTTKVKVIDFGRSFTRICKKSISGQGTLYLNYNCVSAREHSKIRIDKGACLVIHGSVVLYPGVNLHVCPGGVLEIKDGTFINEGTKIAIKHHTIIGEKCAISNDVTIMDSDFHEQSDSQNHECGVSIGNHCWIGANATILKNVTIGRDSIVGANSVVMKSIPDKSVATGNPARVIRNNADWR